MLGRGNRGGTDGFRRRELAAGAVARVAGLAPVGSGMEELERRVLMAADPITTDHPLWLMTRAHGAIVVDGVLDEASWRQAQTIVRSQPYRENSTATIRMLYNAEGVYLSAEVRDQWLWADGRGGGEGNWWEIEQDDSVSFYFDMDNSRDVNFADADRMIGVTLGPQGGSQNGAGAVTRYKWVKGDGAGNAVAVNWGAMLDDGIVYASSHQGTLNDNSDLDTGWSVEIFVPWASLGRTAAPAHGTTIAMNFDVIFDETGGMRDLSVNHNGTNRWTLPGVTDDHIQGVQSAYAATQAGLKGPVGYAEVMFVDAAVNARPATIGSIAAEEVTGYSARLRFLAPTATMSGLGHVTGYQIRYSTAPITSEAAWDGATAFENAYVPRLAGKLEDLRFIGLDPSTTYHVAVRAVDAMGNLGGLSSTSFTTRSATQDVSQGLRVVPSPMGRTLVHENGEAFVPVGDHLGMSWKYVRTLYPGDVWDQANGIFQNFYENTPAEGSADIYFQELAARGVNTMRVYLELPALAYYTGNPDYPRGGYLLETSAGVFSADMRGFMENVLAKADQYGMHIVFSPFDSYWWGVGFEETTPWHVSKGGPLTDINDFFQTPETLEMAKRRMDAVIGWAQASPYAHRIIGWEPVSEWDTYGWTLNAEGNHSPGRENEMRTRATWIEGLAAHIREADPQRLVLQSVVTADPRGPVARSVFYSRNFDATTPHLYAMGNEEGVNNPDADRTVKPAFDNANLTTYWTTNDTLRRPTINGEWGPTREVWPGGVPTYSVDYTQEEDEAVFRAMVWSGLASGQVGTGFRMPSATLAPNGYLLTDEMRRVQERMDAFARGVAGGVSIDFTSFNHDTLAGRLSVTSASGKSVRAWGVSDGAQGIVYLLHDRNASSGAVADGVLTITGLDRDMVVDVEFWATTGGTHAPLQTITAAYVGVGVLQVSVPAFAEDVVMKFKAREKAPEQPQVVVGLRAGPRQLTFALDQAGRPYATEVNNATGAVTEHAIARLTRYVGRITDMTAYIRGSNTNMAFLAATDENRHLWLFAGNLTTGAWTARNLTVERNFPGVTGDLTTYQPKWGSIHIGGVDAKGNAINYWHANTLPDWAFANLTRLISGPTLVGGLTSYVTHWNGLNLAGVNSNGDVIVYWWSPALGPGNWTFLNMTARFDLPKLVGQIDAFVTPGGGLNIVGVDPEGHLQQYWWKPGLSPEPNRWRVTDVTELTGGPTLQPGAQGFVGDGIATVFGMDASNNLIAHRWLTAPNTWSVTNVTELTSSPAVGFPIGGSTWGSTLRVGARARQGAPTLVLFTYDGDWDATNTGVVIAG